LVRLLYFGQDGQLLARVPLDVADLAEARAFCRAFFDWDNDEHRHSGIALLRPADVHDGHAAARLEQRLLGLDQAFAANPERFVRGKPTTPQLPDAPYIKRPPEAIDTAA
jgi:putative transposase